MTLDPAKIHHVLCPLCDTVVEDFQPGVSSVLVAGFEYHPACAQVLYAEEVTHLLRREAGMTCIPEDLKEEMQLACDEGETAAEFVAGLISTWERNADPYQDGAFPFAENH